MEYNWDTQPVTVSLIQRIRSGVDRAKAKSSCTSRLKSKTASQPISPKTRIMPVRVATPLPPGILWRARRRSLTSGSITMAKTAARAKGHKRGNSRTARKPHNKTSRIRHILRGMPPIWRFHATILSHTFMS